MSKTRSIHHIVFSTKHRQPTICEDYKKDLYAYLYGIMNNHKCFVIRINGYIDHVHILMDLHPTISLADMVKMLKQWSSHWLKHNPNFPDFDGWGAGYYAVTLGVDGIAACKQYIMNQENHHARVKTIDELHEMALANGLDWYPDDWN